MITRQPPQPQETAPPPSTVTVRPLQLLSLSHKPLLSTAMGQQFKVILQLQLQHQLLLLPPRLLLQSLFMSLPGQTVRVFYSKLPQTMVSPVNVAPNTSTNNAPTTTANNAPQTTNNAPTTSSTVSSSETEANNAQNTGNSPAPNVPTTSSDAPATTSATSSSSEAPQQNITTSVSTSSTDAQVGAQPTAASSSSTSTSSSTSAPSPSSSGCLTKVPHAIVYSPYDNNRSCKDFSTVLSDLQLIHSKGINELRVYGNDCNYLSTILKAAKQTGFKVNQGFWISDAGVNSIDTAVDDFISYVTSGSGGFGWKLFSYLTIGQQWLLFCFRLISKISEVKGKLQNAGYSGKVTTSEPPSPLKRILPYVQAQELTSLALTHTHILTPMPQRMKPVHLCQAKYKLFKELVETWI